MSIEAAIIIILCSTIFSLILAFPLIKLLYKYKIVRMIASDFSSIIDERRLKSGTPIMGGLIVVITFIIMNLIFNLNSFTKIPLLVFFISAALGAFDDVLNIYGRERPIRSIFRNLKLAKVHANKFYRIFLIITLPWTAFKWFFFILGSYPGKGIQAHEKIIVQLISGLLVANWLFGNHAILNSKTFWIPFFGNIQIGILSFFLAIFLVLFFTNAVNITDGLDGLSAGTLLAGFTGFAVVAYLDQNNYVLFMCLTLIGSLITYIFFNIPPARFQMGDVGSLSLGTLFAIIALMLNKPFLLLIFGLPFIVELLSALFQGITRRIFGVRLLKMAPLHLHYEIKGWSEPKIVMRAWIISILLTLIGILISRY